MLKKFSTLHLFGILGLLIAIYAILYFTGDTSRSDSFREVLVEIDTSKVNRIAISKSSSQFELRRSGDGWKVTLPDDQEVEAVKSYVNSALSSLESIKPTRLVANQEVKWAEFQVDTAGTRVEIFEEDNKTLDLVIGRFGVQGQSKFYTYVRLFNEDEVYAADDFMGISFGSQPSNYRNKEILKLTKDSLVQFEFKYPADSSFILSRNLDGRWEVNGAKSDSASVQNYFNGVRFLSGTEFVDDLEKSDLDQAAFSLVIKSSGNLDVQVDAFEHPEHKWVLSSTHNANARFSDSEMKLVDKLFISSTELMGETGN